AGQGWVLDRHMLPKMALTLITLASLSGVYLTMTTHGASAGVALLRWLHLASLGVLAGGMTWWGFFLRRPDDAGEAEEVGRFVLAQWARFRRIGRAAVVGAIIGARSLVPLHSLALNAGRAPLFCAGTAALLLALAGSWWLLSRSPDPSRVFSFGSVRLVCLALVLALGLTAALDARLTLPGNGLALWLRPVHLIAFGLWMGGAVWNIFIAVPGAQETLALSVVVAGAHALERFRWVVRVILPTLVLTGLAQGFVYVGLEPAALVGSLFGRLILFKIALVAGLFAIFITCPLWRACSPIRGMCDLEELRPSTPEPALQLDNRGRACAGFVRVRQALDSLQKGAVLELLSTDRFSWWELPAWLEMNGYELLEREKRRWRLRRSYRFLIRCTGEGVDAAWTSFRSGRESLGPRVADRSGRMRGQL
ncbi:MAG TPA: sulfurtransferase TusA family protein, partial [Longimicrobiaceae bacterium]|nr:sulfurtransferase TusA family protein [Longimicrobiaceae bacterium]